MTLHLHHLTGCAPTPLAHYLKALGVLRIVAEQADPEARGWWQDEHFCLLTKLDRGQLEAFFLERYAPTPLVSPWNRGSGFFVAEDKGLTPIEQSSAARFAPFRAGIAAARAQLASLNDADARVRALRDSTKAKKGMSASEKKAATARKNEPAFKTELSAAEKRFKELKQDLFKPFALAWRGPHRAWMDAAVVLPESGSPMFPSLLGTGGNDGRLDFTNNAMQRLGELFVLSSQKAGPSVLAAPLLREALWHSPAVGFSDDAIGQFSPGAAGGANSTTGADGSPLINPWDFVLMMEGSLMFGARVTRRLGPDTSARASTPFAVYAHSVGYGSAGREGADRGEQWMPLWTTPTALGDLSVMFGEARMHIGRRLAVRPMDVALAMSRLGVARGISEFVRVGYLERNGQSNLAIPLGRIRVTARPRSRLLDDVVPWMDRLQRAVRDKNAPARLEQAERRLCDRVLDALVHDEAAARWQAILLAAVEVEEIQRGGVALNVGPIPSLSPDWLTACDDGTSTWRLAMALGSAAAGYDNRGRAADPVRYHWIPLKRDTRTYDVREKRLVNSPRVVMTGRDAVDDCVALLERRLVEANAGAQRRLPLVAAPGYDARLEDLAALLDGSVELECVVALARALMAVRWRDAREGPHAPPLRRGAAPDEGWMALRLAHLASPLSDHVRIPVDDAIVRRLDAGDAAAAVELALRRVRSAGLRPPLVAATTSPKTARLWAAALVFPIHRRTARDLARRFVSRTSKEN